MAMDRKKTRKYNIANLLLAVLVKKCRPEVRKNTERMANALSAQANSSLKFRISGQEENIKHYLKQQNEPTEKKLQEYMNWISDELGANYSVSDLDKRLDVDADLRGDIAACRETLNLNPLEEGQSVNSGFYDIHINRWWDKSVMSIDLRNMRDDGMLPNYMLYQTCSAASLWEEVTATEHYVLPQYCRAGLINILQSKRFDEFARARSAFFELGTGSPAKTGLILDRLKATRLPHHFIWVDASTPMLEYNVSKTDTSKYAPLRFSVVSTDFEAVDDLLEFIGERWASDDFHRMRKCYFLLGFTLSNLNEARFISGYAKACKKGDLLIFPMQFIPEEYEPVVAWAGIENSDYGLQLIKAYNSPEGLNLVRAGLSQIKGQTREITAQAQPIKSVGGIPSDDCIGRSVVIRYMANFEHLNQRGAKTNKKLEIIKASRYFEKDFRHFVDRHGFAFREDFEIAENVKAFLIEFVGRNTDSQDIGD